MCSIQIGYSISLQSLECLPEISVQLEIMNRLYALRHDLNFEDISKGKLKCSEVLSVSEQLASV